MVMVTNSRCLSVHTVLIYKTVIQYTVWFHLLRSKYLAVMYFLQPQSRQFEKEGSLGLLF